MEIVNEKGNDLSREMIINIAVMFAMIEGAARMCNLLNRKVDASGWQVNLLHENKKAFNDAQKTMRRLRYQLNNAFDGAIDKIIRNDKDSAVRSDAMGRMGIDQVQIGLAAVSRIDHDYRNKERIIKKILAYKGDPAYNVEELIKMYDIK